ncbi:glycosyltransferase family 2 protein [Aliifodinibius sp. S!AR15-10]|uniref:glycosyltransferase family 2 protein n=1 Tax=Aliifodinibius sp. S!AR15-10 TaxID=2950437 RepID=UPI0028558AAE|nr:glycosyltransferase family A protein [Aliifodinibius sp. S!AR15-10]MDR8393380.1 glycosyltransferase family 2 protein [Aliifodinibius sp. S!AR15-10]
MSKPLVSVIIPTYNRSKLLKRAIDSVLQQTYSHLECLVVDDASTDNTNEVIAEYEDERIIYIRHNENKHVSVARNTGIKHAGGKYLAFLDDDDEWLPSKLEKQVQVFESVDSKVGLIYCWMDFYDGKKLIQQRHPKLRGDIFKETLSSQPIGNASTLLVKTEIAEEIGGFDTNLPRGNDGDFIRRICQNYEVDLVPEVLVRYHENHGNKRITRNDTIGLKNAIISQKTKLKKFRDELDLNPDSKAKVLASIGYFYSQRSDWKNGFKYYKKAFLTCPFSKSLYKYLYRSIRKT